MEQYLFNGDSKDVLKTIQDNSVDLLASDPPYAISFMGKEWDKALPDKEIWEECYRVLKPGAFIAVMSSPRSDVLYRMIMDLEGAGFDMSFSPILWTYHSGFPKASDTKKLMEKRGENGDKYEGSKLGFQPKPAVEHIIIGMKPHGQKSYIDNVLNFENLPENIKMTYPFLQVPKPAKKEKDMGLTNEGKLLNRVNSGGLENDPRWAPQIRHNFHPTTKPVKLMSYIITLFTREGDFVLDPFLGSGTTGIASKLTGRSFVGIEREQEYMDIAKERCGVSRDELVKFFRMEKDNQTKLDL